MSMKLYLDTSIYGGYYDEGMEASVDLINEINARGIEVVYSSVILDEFKNAPDHINLLLKKVLNSIAKKSFFVRNNKVDDLAQKYIGLKVLSHNSIDDARHISLAVLHKCDYIVSWNFRHMVGRNDLYREANNKLNIKHVDIIKPDIFLNTILK